MIQATFSKVVSNLVGAPYWLEVTMYRSGPIGCIFLPRPPLVEWHACLEGSLLGSQAFFSWSPHHYLSFEIGLVNVPLPSPLAKMDAAAWREFQLSFCVSSLKLILDKVLNHENFVKIEERIGTGRRRFKELPNEYFYCSYSY